MKKQIAPSILSADFSRLGEEIKAVEKAGADLIHVDVMDGHFVPNITIGPGVVSSLRKTTSLPFDVHLMIEDPDRYIDAFVDAGSNILTVHAEAVTHLHRTVQYIKAKGARAGVSLNPSTPLVCIEEILPDIDMLLIMTVNPGFGGQKFISGMLPKIRKARELVQARGLEVAIEVDGGVTAENIGILADAGARVIKIERPEGDFARGYDKLARPPGIPAESNGESAYFVWLNRGKQSLVLDLARDDDKAVLAALLAKADVFVQNLKPGALAKLGFAFPRLRKDYPRLICCSISGYGESGPYAQRKAYDMLIQAESGLSSITGGPEAPARAGVSVCDIAAGMNAYGAILEALLARAKTGQGAAISISMFDAMADWMAVPLLQHEGGDTPKRIGLAHTSISPYGAIKSRNGGDVLISIQNDREWRILAEHVMGDKKLAEDPNFATNVERMKRRAETDGRVAVAFARMDVEPLCELLARYDIAFGRINDCELLAHHPHLRRLTVDSPTGPVSMPAPPAIHDGASRRYGAVPALGHHNAMIRKEFGKRK